MRSQKNRLKKIVPLVCEYCISLKNSKLSKKVNNIGQIDTLNICKLC